MKRGLKNDFNKKKNPRTVLQEALKLITPWDDTESGHIREVLAWIKSGAPLYRVVKPATPPKHLVSYFVLFDEERQKILLVDHKKAQLWLPSGGHVEENEHPLEAAKRECREELGMDPPLWKEDPIFLTSTTTVGLTAGHEDVSLWYVMKGDCHRPITWDLEEFHGVRWFGLDEIPYERSDPHMRRFVSKLSSMTLT